MFPFTWVSPEIFSVTCSCVSRTSWGLCHGADPACKQTLFPIHQPCGVRWSSWRNSASFLTRAQKHRFCGLDLSFSSPVPTALFCISDVFCNHNISARFCNCSCSYNFVVNISSTCMNSLLLCCQSLLYLTVISALSNYSLSAKPSDKNAELKV